MKLSKLYCNDRRFKDIKFNLKGLNVIYAEVQSLPNEKKNSHDLGKTKLVELIDFLLLKEIDKLHFLLKKKEVFDTFVFYLELKLNSGKYLTIRRSVDNHSKIAFSLQNITTEGFIPPKKWDKEEIAIKNAQEMLNTYLALDFFKDKDYNYRKSIGYSLRRQQDFADVYSLSKFSKGKHKDWKPFMFDFLGFDGKLLKEKYANDEKQEKIREYINNLRAEFSVSENSRDEIVGQLSIKTTEVNKIASQIDAFNFYEQDKELTRKGVDEIENKIAALNTSVYLLEYDIQKLEDSIRNNFAFNLNKVIKIFDEAALFFPKELKKDYKNLLDFNRELTDERNKNIREQKANKEQELKKATIELQQLNNTREQILSFLQDTDTFRKFKAYQKELSEKQSEVINLQKRLEIIDLIIQKEQELDKLKKDITETIDELKKIARSTDTNIRYKKIRDLFATYFKEVMNEDVYISWSLNGQDNVDFHSPKITTKENDRIDTVKDEGNTYRKLLCVIFDLAVLVAYSDVSYFRFVYHDDVLSQQDNGIKNRLLGLVSRVSKEYDFQYILSVIKSDLPTDENDKPIYFKDSEIILRLSDEDEKGTLFGFDF